MKNLYLYIVAAVMIVGATACQKLESEVSSVSDSFTFNAQLGSTRTELGEGNKLLWNEGDNICIYTPQNTGGVVFTGDATSASATANFSATAFTPSEDGYFAIYPENLTNIKTWPYSQESAAATFVDGVWSVMANLPDRYYSEYGGWDDRFNYVVAYSSDQTLKFQAATAYLKVVYRGQNGFDLDISTSIANLSGTAMLNYDTKSGEISYTPIDTSGTVFIYDVQDGQTFYIPVYPITVSSLSIFSTERSTNKMELIYSCPDKIKFEAGKIYTVELNNGVTQTSYTLKSKDGSINVPMTLNDRGLYQALDVINPVDVYIEVNDGGNITKISAAQPIVSSRWLAATIAEDSYFTHSDGESFDIYLSMETGEICMVVQGAIAPLLPKEEAELELLGAGQMCEGIINTQYSLDNQIVDVDIYQHAKYPGYLYLKNAYTKNYQFNGSMDYRVEDVYMVIDAREHNSVNIPFQHTGRYVDRVHFGEILIGSLSAGTLKDGVITFPKGGLVSGLTIYTGGEVNIQGNHSGAFYVMLPGAQLPEESGLFFSAYLGYLSEVTPGDDGLSDSTCLAIVMQGKDVVEVSYVLLMGDSGLYTPLEGNDAQEYVQQLCVGSGLAENQLLYKLPEGELIDTVNRSGLISYTGGLKPATYYTLIAKALNSNGDANYVVHTKATKPEEAVAQSAGENFRAPFAQPNLVALPYVPTTEAMLSIIE